MTPTTDIKHTAQRGHRWLLNGMLPLAACMAIVTAAPTARAELANQSVACAGAQQTEGEGGSASTFAQQQKTATGICVGHPGTWHARLVSRPKSCAQSEYSFQNSYTCRK